jgi:hypothetical protein
LINLMDHHLSNDFLRDQPEIGGTMKNGSVSTLSLLVALLTASSWAFADDVRTGKAARATSRG